MTNDELQNAINEIFDMIRRTGNDAGGLELKARLEEHLEKLLHIQQVRAAGWTARPNEEEGTSC